MSTSDLSTRITQEITSYLEGQEVRFEESLNELRMMMNYEDQDWIQLFGQSADEVSGADLEEVQKAAESARKKVAISSLPKRAADLHAGYVFGNNLEISGTEREEGKTGAPSKEVKFFEDSVNQENIFSGAAKRELQYARFTDGNVLAFCDTAKKQVRMIPIGEIDNIMYNPDHPDEIWAWLRVWDRTDPKTGESRQEKAWAYSNRFSGDRQQSIKTGEESIRVLPSVTVVDLRCNRQVGWTFGIGDAVAGLHWAEAYGKVLTWGQTVSEGLAKIIYKVTNTKTKKGAQDVGVKMGGPGVGQGVALGEGQDIALVNATQRSFDYTHARPLAAMAASAWNISNIDLLADSSAAGSSYGAAQSLSEGVRNAMNSMREEWTQFYQDIFVVMSLKRPAISWPPMEKPDAYRMAQELTLYSVALTDEEYRAEVLDRLDIPGKANEIPPMLAARGQVQVQAASPDQGQNSDAGSADSTSKNDTRTDGITEVLKQMQQDDYLRNLTGLVERMEAAVSQK